MITDLRNVDFVSFHIKPSISDETWDWVKTELRLSVEAGTLTSDGFVSCVDLGFIRASEGSRYNKTLHPSIDNKTVPVPGGNGNYYFGMFWRDKQQTIPIAYDAMTEEQMRAITLLFAGDRKMWDIYFDEAPYKVYHVKLVQPITLNYICIDDTDDATTAPAHIIHNHELGDPEEDAPAPQLYGRLYKGEGSIQIQAYTPFARERFKYLNDYAAESTGVLNLDEWSSASRMIAAPSSGDTQYDTWLSNHYNIWNAGDLETDWNMIFEIASIPSGVEISNTIGPNNNTLIKDDDKSVHKLKINAITADPSSDTHIRINTALNIIEGGIYGTSESSTPKFTPSGSVYDKYRAEGKYFKLLRGESCLKVSAEPTDFEYHYKYF